MKEFTSIGALRHVVSNVRRYCDVHSKPLPTLTYEGTVKLHGTNAGVRVTKNKVQAQKRSAIIDIGNDNYGFAAFVHPNVAKFRYMAERYYADVIEDNDDITFFGEWVGGNIQKGVALSQCAKHFVIFGIYAYDRKSKESAYKPFELNILYNVLSPALIAEFNKCGIWFIKQVPSYNVMIDFNAPQEAAAKISEMTIKVEESCPWGELQGVKGIGEGIVWIPIEHSTITNMWFKSKGLKHQDASKETKKVQFDPVKAENIKQLLVALLPAWRLEQGISVLREQNLEITSKNTGEYIKWICQDILKEETDVITSNGFCWKDIVPSVSREVRQYYLTEINKV